MLQSMRSNKARKVTAWILVLFVGVPFIFYYGWSPSTDTGPMTTPIVEVNGTPIFRDRLIPLRLDFVTEVVSQRNPQYAQILLSNPDVLEEDMPLSQMTDEAIRYELLAQAAANQGLQMGPRERDDVIRAFTLGFVDTTQGIPNWTPDQWNRNFALLVDRVYNYSPARMAEYLHGRALRNRAASVLIYPQARTSILELWQAYEQTRTEYRLACAVFTVSDHLASAEIADEEIEQYHADHPEDFTVGERRVYEFVAVRRDEIAAGVEVTDQDVSDEYEASADDHIVPAIYTLRQIVADAIPDSEERPEDLEDALAALAAGQNFGTVAADWSADDITAENGGMLGRRVASQLDPLALEALSGLATGEITEPVRIGGSWLIYQLADFQPEVVFTLQQVSAEIRAALRDREIARRYDEREEEFIDVRETYTALSQMADALNLEITRTARMDPAASYIPDLGSLNRWQDDLDRLEIGELHFDVINTGNTVALLRLAEVSPSEVQPLDDDLREAVRRSLARTWAQEQAEGNAIAVRDAALSGARVLSGEFFTPAWEAASVEEDVIFREVQTASFQPLSDVLQQVGAVAGLARDLYYSPIESISEVRPISDPGGRLAAGYVVWMVQDRVEPELEEFYADLLPMRSLVIRGNQNRFVAEWFADEFAPGVNEITRLDLAQP